MYIYKYVHTHVYTCTHVDVYMYIHIYVCHWNLDTATVEKNLLETKKFVSRCQGKCTHHVLPVRKGPALSDKEPMDKMCCRAPLA